MAETPEEAFLRSMSVQQNTQVSTGNSADGENHNELNNVEKNVVGDEAQQIESSDEYDTTQDVVQDVSTTSTAGHQQAQVSSSIDSAAETTSTNPAATGASRPNSTVAPNTSSAVPATSSTNKQISSQNSTSMSSTPVLPKARLPNDLIGILEDRIEEDPKGDTNAWLSLIDEYKRRGKSEDVRKTYVRFLEAFPLAAEQWAAYIQFENDANNRRGVEDLFKKVLQDLPNFQLWTAYLDHIRRHFNPSTSQDWSKTVGAAFQAVLNNVGGDKDSGKLWLDYIEFLKSAPGTLGKTDWESQAKMDQLRKAYQDAVTIPTQSVESLWKEYSAFENSLNKMTGRQNLQKKSQDYLSARGAFTEIQNITRGLNRTTIPKLPPALGFEGDVEYVQQVDIWKRWIQWEKDDPLLLKDENPKDYKKRVMYVYMQALMSLTFWPEMWFDAAEWCFANDMAADGERLLTQGTKFNPESSLLAFKRADRLEMTSSNGNDDDSKLKRGEAVCEPFEKLLDALYSLVDKALSREKQEIAKIEAEHTEESITTNGEVSPSNSDDEDDDAAEEGQAKKAIEQRKEAKIKALKAISSIQTTLLSKCISHTWIAYMRAMQRMQGKGKAKTAIGGSRQVFRNSHKRGRITSDLWLAAGLLEFHTSDVKAARNVLDRGWKKYPEDEVYTLKYIEFLTQIDDQTNARVVFEQTVTKLISKPETLPKAKPLFAFFHSYESQYGELASIQKLETRMKELFPEDPKLNAFSQRFVFNNFDPTVIRPIISPATQTRPRALPLPIPVPLPTTIVPTVEQQPQSRQPTPPTATLVPALPVVISSPKRSLEEAFGNDTSRPNKIARGESPNPLAGAAGRRLNQLRGVPASTPVVATPIPISNSTPAPPPPLPRDVTFLLGIIPPASTYDSVTFNPEAMVRLIQDTHIPNSVDQLPGRSGAGGFYN